MNRCAGETQSMTRSFASPPKKVGKMNDEKCHVQNVCCHRGSLKRDNSSETFSASEQIRGYSGVAVR